MWPNPQFSADLVAFTEKDLNEKLPFLCSFSYFNTVLHSGFKLIQLIIYECKSENGCKKVFFLQKIMDAANQISFG